MRLLLVREKWDHMSDFSGFDPLFKAIASNDNFDCTSILINEVKPEPLIAKPKKKSIIDRVINKVKLKLGIYKVENRNQEPINKPSIQLTPGVQPVHELAFQKIVKLDAENRFDFILFSVAEDQLGKGLYHAPDEIKRRCVLFFHQPPSWQKLNWIYFEVLNKFALLVTLSTEHYHFFKSRTNSKVIQIRHGVDLSFFKPLSVLPESTIPKVLFVGSWFRDFEMLYQVNRELLKQGIRFELHCVIPRKDRQNQTLIKLAVHSNVSFHADLSANELKQLYQSADLFFLPLVDSTANNGLNEALSTGLFVVASDIGGVRDYVLEDHCLLARYGDVLDHTEKLKMAILNYKNYKSNISSIIRKHAEMVLDWNTISKALLAELKQIKIRA